MKDETPNMIDCMPSKAREDATGDAVSGSRQMRRARDTKTNTQGNNITKSNQQKRPTHEQTNAVIYVDLFAGTNRKISVHTVCVTDRATRQNVYANHVIGRKRRAVMRELTSPDKNVQDEVSTPSGWQGCRLTRTPSSPWWPPCPS